MKKFLLTLVAAFVAFGAFAEEYPVVTSVEELASYPDNTMVLFQNIEVTIVEQDYGYYVQQIPCLSDGTTQIGGSVYPVPACFTAVGYVSTVENWDGTTYREFYVESVESVSKFASLGELLRFASMEDNIPALKNSTGVVAETGTAIVSSVYEDNVFFYTMVSTGYYTQAVYGVLKYAEAAELLIGDEVASYGGFKGTVVPAEAVYDENWNLVSYKGGHYAMDSDVYLYATNWESAINIQYSACALSDFANGYVAEAQAVRAPKGGTFVEKEGKYYYEAEVEVEEYVDGEGWVWVTKTYSVQVASAYIDLSEYVGKVCEDYIAGVWDWCNTGDESRLLINKFISPVTKHDNVADFLALGAQYEEEILTSFENPLLVTYVYADDYKCIVIAQDESGAVAIDYSEIIGTGSEDETAILALKPGDMITGVKGYAQFNPNSASPAIMGATYDWQNDVTVVYTPVVESSGNEVKPAITVTVGDLLNEWNACQEKSIMPTIANNVVRLLGVQVVDTLDQWGSPVTYMIQGTDTMELSNLWGENKFNFTTYESNNIVGIADFCRINSNYIYQIQPLSQEYITDANDILEVSSYEELVANEGTPVLYRGVEVAAVNEGYYMSYYMCDGQVYMDGFPVAGKFDLKGVYAEGGFAVSEVVAVHGFATISDLDSYVANVNPDAAGQAFEILGEMPVSYVDGENVFVYFTGVNSWGGSQKMGSALLGVKTAVKVGDVIKGVKGVSHATNYYTDENWNNITVRGAYFEVAEDAEITVVSSDNAVSYSAATDVMGLVYSAYSYNALPIKLNAGVTIVERDGKYYAQTESEVYAPADPNDPNGEWVPTMVTYEIEVASTALDLSTYVGKTTEDIFCGVLNYKNTSEDVAVYYIQSAESLYREYENIAALIAAGGNGGDFISVLKNQVVISYIHDSGWDKSMFVQDETGGLYIMFAYPYETLEGVNVGDALEGLKGKAEWDESWGRAASLRACDPDWYDYPLNVVSTGNEVTVKDVTLAELAAEADKAINEQVSPYLYANTVVKVSNVTFTSGIDAYGEEWPCIVQDTDTLWVIKKFAENWGVEEGNEYNITGVVDHMLLNYNNIYTIQPRSAEDVSALSAVEGVEALNNGIFVNAANQVVAAGATEVAVYDLNGRLVATANADVVDVNALAQGVYVARAKYADGATKAAKVVR